MFAHTPESATTVTVTLSDYGDNNVDLLVYSFAGAYEESRDNDPTETVTLELDAGQTYYFVVEPTGVTDTTSYVLTIQ